MTKKRRFILIAIGALVFAMTFLVGASVEMSEEEATELKEEFEKQVENIDAIGIFLNNVRIALTMFIPALGVVVGVVSAFSTGMVFNAIVSTTPQLADVPPLAIFVTPFGVMEIFSYGVAMSQSGILINAIVRKHDLKPMMRPAVIEIGIVAVVLLAGAYIEFYMIEALQPEMELIETV